MRIFVTVGNSLDPFDRLLRMVDAALPPAGIEGLCQHGVSAVRPRGLQAVSALPRREFERELERADVVVCHAGVGTLWSAMQAGHCPVVIPRLASHREIVNDHQLEICAELEREGLLRVVASQEDLVRAITSTTRRPVSQRAGDSGLESVRDALEVLGRSKTRARSWLLRALAAAAPPIERLRFR